MLHHVRQMRHACIASRATSAPSVLARGIVQSAPVHDNLSDARERAKKQRARPAVCTAGAQTRENATFDERFRVIERDHMFGGAHHKLVHGGSFSIDDFARSIMRPNISQRGAASSFKILDPTFNHGEPEQIQNLFIVAGREHELDESGMDQFHTSWPAVADATAAERQDANLGCMPLMLVDGVPLGHVSVIKRVVAKRMGLYSSDDIEAAQIDTIDEHLRDVKKDYQDARELGPLAVEQWFLLSLPKWMAGLEGCLSESGFAVGSKLSWADVEIFTFVTTFLGHREGAVASIKDCPKIQRSVELIRNIPKMAARLGPES